MYTKNILMITCFILGGLLTSVSHADNCVLSSSEVVTLYFGVEIDLPHPEHSHTLSAAHTDIEIPLRFDSGWDIHIKTDLPAANTRVETEDALFPLYEGHRQSFSGSVPTSFEFIGAAKGQTFWYYNQNEAPAAGFDSQDMTSSEREQLCLWDPNLAAINVSGDDQWLQVNLIEVRGPAGGHVSMFQESGPTPTVFFSTYDGGITEGDVYCITAGSHSHNSWAFTQPGLYEVDIRVSTYHLCDETLTADINKDCIVNLADFAAIAGQWLSCGSSFGAECP